MQGLHPSLEYCNKPFAANVREIAAAWPSTPDYLIVYGSYTELQACFQLCRQLCLDLKQFSHQLIIVASGLEVSQQELQRLDEELIKVKEHILQCYKSLTQMEEVNVVLLHIIKQLSEKLSNINIDNYIICPFIKTKLMSAINTPDNDANCINANSAKIYQKVSESYYGDISVQIKRLQQYENMHMEVLTLHTKFTYVTMEEIRNLQHDFLSKHTMSKLKLLQQIGIKYLLKLLPCLAPEKPVSLCVSRDTLRLHVNDTKNRMILIGQNLQTEVAEVKETVNTAMRQHYLIQESMQNKKQLLRDIYAQIHIIFTQHLILDEKNDALVGKLVKTRPLFNTLLSLFAPFTIGHDLFGSHMNEMNIGNFSHSNLCPVGSRSITPISSYGVTPLTSVLTSQSFEAETIVKSA